MSERNSPLNSRFSSTRRAPLAACAGARLAGLVRPAELDALQDEGRGRQQAGIDRAGDVEVEPGQATGACLELPAILSPIDQKRTHQRRNQRQDDRNRKSEQRRLHASPQQARRSPAPAAEPLEGLITDELSTIPMAGLSPAAPAPPSCPTAP